MKNTLIVATTSYAGMGPYVSEIVNSFQEGDNVFFLFREYDDDFFRLNVKEKLKHQCTFVKIPNTHWNTLIDLIINQNRLLKHIIHICKENNIRVVHYINCPVDTNTRRTLNKMGIRIISTIHDLKPHEAKKEWYKMIRHKITAIRLAEYVSHGDYFITNSKTQETNLRSLYPLKTIYYHPFPSLVTEMVKDGHDCPHELLNHNLPYILFFGRIEEYKGLSLLYDVFSSTPDLYNSYSLVIAGKGTCTSNLDVNNLFFINRYIKDTEIAWLYKNAAVVVYPYISATQSGVLSLAFYFGTPIIASDVPFFKELIINSKNGVLFKNGDKDDLRHQLLSILKTDTTEMSRNEIAFYDSYYSREKLRQELLNIYSK